MDTQITGRPHSAAGSGTWVPCTGTARTSFRASVPPVVLATGSLLSNQHCYHPAWSLAVAQGNSGLLVPTPACAHFRFKPLGRARKG